MRILGIELGSSSIKAVEMDSAFGRYEIHDYHEWPVGPDGSTEDAVQQLLRKLPKAPDRIVAAMPTHQSTVRNFSLPTRDKKAIQSGVGFELEDELPFPIEDCVYDYAVLSQNKQGSWVHVATTLKRHLLSFIEICQKSKIEPDVITTEAWAYRILLNRVLGPTAQQEVPILLCQIGHTRTTFYLHWKGAPTFIRDIEWGGRDITAEICQHYDIPVEQAEAKKLDQGFISTPNTTSREGSEETSAEQIEFSQCIESALKVFASELRQVDLMVRNVTHKPLGMIYLAGGTSLLPGLISWVEQRTKTPTKPLLALSAITPSGVTYSDQTDVRFLLAASLALSQVGPERALCINFRTGAFSKESKSREINFDVLKKPLIAVGIVSLCLLLSLVVQSSVYKSELQSTDAQLEKSVRSFFGQLSSSGLRTYMSNASLLRTSINKEINRQREMSKLLGPNPHSPIDFLNSLSAAIPKDIVLDLLQFQNGGPPGDPFSSSDQSLSTSLTFLVSNPQQAERLASLVNSKVSNVQRGKMEEISPS